MRLSRRLIYKHWNPETYWKNKGCLYRADETGCNIEKVRDVEE